eukprot:Protomagalhaensia_sp_Gyna_25__394@NODE_1187_length_2084_cov_139_054279_g943_i0_p1_GENE_NODE_1187_length_2084_cov_139_054279_g943_i0NODE_1187_length_2084_cov_139_054279_g943_i0_p1_ORF_typecomplete_len507_score63_84Sugar_tr/PF00083_24/1_1e88MFS_1/PF07690_16/4_6e15MFS_1/PF07690_16/1_1e06TRI12/PF06609_13/2_3e09TRI12/PF06609_13/1_6e03TRI12/PF06609_13/2_3e03MFS_4/PF06779_14/9_2e03MFS_4/PF06779_14/1_2e05MFS_4/PF06779_14/4_8e03MFS_4/PF06779_14/1e04MFS_3/PF05977_13/0_00035MFS_3/PF05977_13/2_NODE_1187_len
MKESEEPMIALPDDGGLMTVDWSRSMSCCGCFSYLLELSLVAALSSFVFGLQLALLNTSMSYVSWEYEWCDPESIADCSRHKLFSSLVSSSLYVGAAIGAVFAGSCLAFGRRTLLMMSDAVFILGAVSCACANSFAALTWARVICGVGVGLATVGTPAYLSEVCPPNVRGKYGVLHQLFICLGLLTAALLGLPLALASPIPEAASGIYVEQDLLSRIWWRVVVAFPIVPCLLQLVLLNNVYPFETPHCLIERGHYGDAKMLYRRILGRDDVSEALNSAVKEIELSQVAAKAGATLASSMRIPEYRKAILIGCVLAMFQQLGGINVFMSSSTALFIQAGLKGAMPTVMTIVMQAIFTAMVLPSVPLIESLGRKPLLLWGSLGMGLSTLPAAICYWAVGADSDVTMWLAIVGCFLVVACFANTYGPVLWVHLFEMFPIEIKGAANGLAGACVWISCVVIVFVAGNLDNNVNYTLFTSMNFVGCLFVWAFMLETKGRVIGDSPYVRKAV